MLDLETTQAKLVAENDVLQKENARLKYLNQFRASTTAEPSCGATNFQTPEQRVCQGGGDVERPPRLCWTCGDPRHYSRKCPLNVRQPHHSHQGVQPRLNGSSDFRTAEITSNCSERTNKQAAYLRARVNGQEQDSLLDSGSEVSVLPATLVCGHILRPTDKILRAANGTKIKVLGEATVSFETPQYSSSVNGLVSEHVAEVMLGIDWLRENNATWDFKGSSVLIGGYRHKLNVRRRDQHWCRRVVLQ